MRKWLLFFIPLVCIQLLNAQSDTVRNVKFSGVIGHKIFNPSASYYPIYQGAVYFPGIIGGEMYFPKAHLSIDVRRELFMVIVPNNIYSDIALLDKTSMAGITWHFGYKNNRLSGWRVGAGYTNLSRRNIFTSGSFITDRYHGFTLFVGFPLKWIDVELRANPDQIDIIGGDKYGINLLYRFGAAQTDRKIRETNWGIKFIFGLKCSGNRYYKSLLRKSAHEPLIIYPEYGFNVFSKKMPFYIDLRRSLWIGFNGGSARVDINGYIEYLSAGLGAAYPVFGGKWKPALVFSHVWGKDIGVVTNPMKKFYTEKGFGINLKLPVRQIDVEVKTIIPYHFDPNVIGPKGSLKDRTSLGIVYSFGRNK